MLKSYIEAVGLYAPGLIGWEHSRPILAGDAAYAREPLAKYKAKLLPPNERRRATMSVSIAFGACEDAIGERLTEASTLAAVFASSGGDYGVHDKICGALVRDEIAVSPTHFHNSVHNAPAGYWSIASTSRAPSVSLSAHDHSVAAGLLEALPMLVLEETPLLLVFSDCEVVGAMRTKRPITNPFACALWLTPSPSPRSIASLEVTVENSVSGESRCSVSALEPLRKDNPSARILPFLELLAAGSHSSVTLKNQSGQSIKLQLGAP